MSKNIAISVNGGGALGIGPLAFMCKLEQDTSFAKSISARSFAFAGTSTGAIIVACLAEGKTAHDTFELYRKNLKAIFTKYPWYKRTTAFGLGKTYNPFPSVDKNNHTRHPQAECCSLSCIVTCLKKYCFLRIRPSDSHTQEVPI